MDRKFRISNQSGFTLMELMVTAAIVAVLAGIALNAYDEYIETSKQGVARQNIASLKILLEDYYLDNDTYVGATPAGLGFANEGGFTTTLSSLTATGYSISSTTSVGGTTVTVTCSRNRTANTYTCT